jgi:hypothetical protein
MASLIMARVFQNFLSETQQKMSISKTASRREAWQHKLHKTKFPWRRRQECRYAQSTYGHLEKFPFSSASQEQSSHLCTSCSMGPARFGLFSSALLLSLLNLLVQWFATLTHSALASILRPASYCRCSPRSHLAAPAAIKSAIVTTRR